MNAEMGVSVASVASVSPSLSPSVSPSLGAMGRGFEVGDRNMPALNKDIFSNTRPATSFTDFQDRPVFSKDILKETMPIASAEKIVFEAANAQIGPVPEVTAEDELPIMESSITTGAIKEDLKLASNVKGLLVEVGFSEDEAVEVSTRILGDVLAKKGIETEMEVKNEEEVSKKVGDATENKERKEVKKEKNETVELVRDEYADNARRKDAEKAIDIVFEGSEEATGENIILKMNQSPAEDEIS